MPNDIAKRLQELGHELPAASAPAANYVSAVKIGPLLFISGQISQRDNKPAYFGLVGVQVTVEEGRLAAESAALGLLAHIAAATDGSLGAVRRVIRLGVFVASASEFIQHSQVANGASDLIVAVFGDAGRHARTAVGVASLPQGVSVEVDAIVELG